MDHVVLLGAGASKPAGVPLASEMTKEMLRRFARDKNAGPTLRFVAGALQQWRGIRGEDPLEGLNVEEIVTAVRLLADRHDTELSAFVGAWHPAVENLEGVSSSSALFDALDDVFERGRDVGENWFNRKHKVKDAIQQFSARSSPVTSYEPGAQQRAAWRKPSSAVFEDVWLRMVQALRALAWVQDEVTVSYLVPLVQWAGRQKGTIATLNYDNAVELAAHREAIEVLLGVNSWNQTGVIPGKGESARLLKLHGSSDWLLKNGRIERISSKSMATWAARGPTLHDTVFAQDKGEPGVIFGGKNKLTARGPFLDLLAEFARALSAANRLTVVGYSFGDAHVNEIVSRWRRGQARELTVVEAPGFEFRGSALEASKIVPTDIFLDGAEAGFARFFAEHPSPGS